MEQGEQAQERGFRSIITDRCLKSSPPGKMYCHRGRISFKPELRLRFISHSFHKTAMPFWLAFQNFSFGIFFFFFPIYFY